MKEVRKVEKRKSFNFGISVFLIELNEMG